MDQLIRLFYDVSGKLTWPGKFLAILLILIGAFVLVRILRGLINRLNESRLQKIPINKAKTVNQLLFSLLRAVIYFFALTMILDLFGINTNSIIAAAGIGGVALAFGAQSIVADIISGLFILIDNEFNVGDYVTLEANYAGTVLSIGLRRTLIIAYTGVIYSIPNAQIKVIANYQRRNIQCDIRLPVDYRVSVDRIKTMIEELADRTRADHSDLYTTHPYFIGVEEMNNFNYVVLIGALTKPGDQWKGSRLLRELSLSALSEMDALPWWKEEGAKDE